MFIGGSGWLGAASQTCVRAASILPQRGRPSTGDVGSYNCTMSDAADRSLLGGLAPAAFLRRHWQKRTLLVQGVNLHLPAGEALLRRFAFIPYARLDDLMISYAAPGGGVGAHADSYDVFLLQGEGRRRWRISRQRDLDFVPGLPLKILADFRPTDEWILEPGDMLYLPPGVAHDGIAESECLTWSIGFRAPSDQELAHAFLDHLRDTVSLAGHYGDAGAAPTARPGELPAAMVAHAEQALAGIRWNRAAIRDFCGRFLTEPKANVFFDPPARSLTPAAFRRRASRAGI